MKDVRLKSNFISPVTLEIKPYINRTFYPNVIVSVEDSVYNKYREYYFDKVYIEKNSINIKTEEPKVEEPKTEEPILNDFAKDIELEIIDDSINNLLTNNKTNIITENFGKELKKSVKNKKQGK